MSEAAPNVFVGTTYSFFNEFILLPYATVFCQLGLDKVFLDLKVDPIVEAHIGSESRVDKPAKWAQTRNWVIGTLLKEGLVPFDQIAVISARLMKEKRVAEVVCSRIQYLFIDEFQDMNTTQWSIIQRILDGGQTQFFLVIQSSTFLGTHTTVLVKISTRLS